MQYYVICPRCDVSPFGRAVLGICTLTDSEVNFVKAERSHLDRPSSYRQMLLLEELKITIEMIPAR